MILSNKVYDVLKWIAQIFLPAAGTLYFALAKVWGLPYAAEVVGTIAAVDAFLGAVLGLSSASYKGEGTLQIDTSDPEKDVYRLVYSGNLEELAGKDKVTFAVDNKVKLGDEE